LDAPSGFPVKRLAGIERREKEKHNAEALSSQRPEKTGGGEGGWLDCDEDASRLNVNME
jgi:hypothetical protein